MDDNELYFTVAQTKFQRQRDHNATLEIKATGVVGLAATLGGIFALVVTRLSPVPFSDFSPLSLSLVVTFVALLLATIGFGLNGLRPREWREDPTLEQFSEYLHSTDREKMVEWAGNQYRNSVAKNKPVLDSKADSVILGMTSLALMVVALIGLGISFTL